MFSLEKFLNSMFSKTEARTKKIIFYTFSSFFRKKSTECRLHIRPDRVYTKYLKQCAL